jgi:hypothetical protein
MRIKFLAVVSIILAMLVGSPTYAATGFRYGPKDLDRVTLIKLIHDSMARDKNGNAPIFPELCPTDPNACATPRTYLEAFQVFDKEAGLTDPNQVEGYLATLTDGEAPNDGDEYWTACVAPPSGAPIRHSIPTCEHRQFHQGEKISFNPKTKRIVLAWDCKNPVGGRYTISVTAAHCALIHIGTHEGDILREIVMVPTGDHVDDLHRCLAVKLPGQTKFVPLTEDCPDWRCNPAHYEQETGLQSTTYHGSQRSPGGEVVLSVPAYFAGASAKSAVVLCDKQKDGTSSCGKEIVGMSYRPYHDNPNPDMPAMMQAYVTYQGEEVPGRAGVNWRWNTPDHPCPMPKL